MKKSSASTLKRKKTSTHQFREPFMINPNGPDWGQGQYDLPVYATQPGNGGKIYPTTSQDWRFNRMGELTPAEILKKIAAPEIAQTLQKFLELFATQELVTFPTMAQEKRRHGKDGAVHDDYLSLLTWYVKQYRPLTYLEVGPALGLPAALTAYLNTPVHIYGFEDWNNLENPISLHPYRYTDALRVVNHHGHVRFISGSELESNVQGWTDSRIHDKLDLIFYANHHPVDRIVADGEILLSHLARGGCFILRHLDNEILRAAGSLLSQSAPDLLWAAGRDFVAALHTGNEYPLSFPNDKRTSELSAMDLLSPEDGLSHVQKLYSDGEVEIAIFRLGKLLKRFPENADLHWLMGKLLLDLFLENQSIKFYKRAAEIAPDRPDLFLHYARNVLYINDVKALETLMKEFTTRFEGDDAYQPLLGYAYVLQGRAKEAYPLLQRYLSHHPADIECLYFMLECAMDVGELIVADEMVQKIAITIPDLPKDVRGMKADIDRRLSAAKLTVAKMVATGDAAKAVERFGEELSSDVACLCRDLGHILQMQGDRRQSEVYLAFHRVISETLMKQG
ncbi:MAG: hypothetical protein HY835_06645 [Anaerolineae bacterium]|nr:hypothetical protein [Anaerolineae bacterium]